MIEKNPNRFILDPKYSVVASFENPNPSGVPNTNIYASNGNIWIGEARTTADTRLWFYRLVESNGAYSFQERIDVQTYISPGGSSLGETFPFFYNDLLYVTTGRATFDDFYPRLYRVDPDTGDIINQWDLTIGQGRLYIFVDVKGTLWGTQKNKLFRFDNIDQLIASNPAHTITTAFSTAYTVATEIIKRGEGNLVYAISPQHSAIVTPDPTTKIFEGDEDLFFGGGNYQVNNGNAIVSGVNDRVYVSSAGSSPVVARARYNNDVVVNEWRVTIAEDNTRVLLEYGAYFYACYDDIDGFHLLRMNKDTGAILEDRVIYGVRGRVNASGFLSQDILIILYDERLLAFDVPSFNLLATTIVASNMSALTVHPLNNYKFTIEN